MAILRVKRGTTKPSTANLAYVGELAFDYTNNALYARNSTSVVKVGGELEMIYSYEGTASLLSVSLTFDPNYIYKVHVIATTQGSSGRFIFNYFILSNFRSYKSRRNKHRNLYK